MGALHRKRNRFTLSMFALNEILEGARWSYMVITEFSLIPQANFFVCSVYVGRERVECVCGRRKEKSEENTWPGKIELGGGQTGVFVEYLKSCHLLLRIKVSFNRLSWTPSFPIQSSCNLLKLFENPRLVLSSQRIRCSKQKC